MISSAERTVLIVFVKNPVPGHVKTRIAATVGDEMALSIYNRLLAYTATIAKKSILPVHVFYSTMLDHSDIWEECATEKHVQNGGDLGDRMRHAFHAILQRFDSALIIGSDCGMLRQSHIKAAVDALRYSDVCIGPSVDGGYYLLGLKRGFPDVFTDVSWSTNTVFQTTMHHLIAACVDVHLMETLSDVDHYDDWVQLGWDKE